MDPILVVIIALGTALLGVTAYMEWIGVMSAVTRRTGGSCRRCDRPRALPRPHRNDTCWSCRHEQTRQPFRFLAHR